EPFHQKVLTHFERLEVQRGPLRVKSRISLNYSAFTACRLSLFRRPRALAEASVKGRDYWKKEVYKSGLLLGFPFREKAGWQL
ncbi:hypothetical protein K2X33_11825, partial [bacterium]|nr:hypothetical protein [bacterium]